MGKIGDVIRRLTGRAEPVPPGTGQRIQEREQAEARRRLLEANRGRESRWSGR